MSIFDRFRAPGRKNPPQNSSSAPVSTGVTAQPATIDRRLRSRRDARKGVSALIIDDSPTVLAALGRILRSAGYVTREVLNAEQGLAAIADDAPDLVFLDIVLPGMNGFNALRAIRKDPTTQHIPVIMISGNEHATEQFYAHRIGADHFMKKPFSRFEVFAHVELLLDADRVPSRKTTAESGAEAENGIRPESFSPTTPQPLLKPTGQALDEPEQLSLVALSALHARKELTALGFQYFDQEQFFAAIRRGDQLAVELFVAGGGLLMDTPLEGKTALGLAKEHGNESIIRAIAHAHPL
jgi:DNA-binding response OmpR family regulator